jgi:predicted RNase H-like nuclease (RuvC/YqgF family)
LPVDKSLSSAQPETGKRPDSIDFSQYRKRLDVYQQAMEKLRRHNAQMQQILPEMEEDARNGQHRE